MVRFEGGGLRRFDVPNKREMALGIVILLKRLSLRETFAIF
jgi:hypothetical protein